MLSGSTNGPNGIFLFILGWEKVLRGVVRCGVPWWQGQDQDAWQSPVSCLGSCCSAWKLLSQKLNVRGSRAGTSVFTEQIKAGEKKGKALKWLWVFFKW